MAEKVGKTKINLNKGLKLDKIEFDKLVKMEDEIKRLTNQVESIVQTIQGDLFNTEKRLKVMMSRIEENAQMCKDYLELMNK